MIIIIRKDTPPHPSRYFLVELHTFEYKYFINLMIF